MESLSKLEDMKPSLLYPGHGPMVTNGVAKIQQYISHRMERERQVCEDIHLISSLDPTLSRGETVW